MDDRMHGGDMRDLEVKRVLDDTVRTEAGSTICPEPRIEPEAIRTGGRDAGASGGSQVANGA